jgi:hypothetical protein
LPHNISPPGFSAGRKDKITAFIINMQTTFSDYSPVKNPNPDFIVSQDITLQIRTHQRHLIPSAMP